MLNTIDQRIQIDLEDGLLQPEDLESFNVRIVISHEGGVCDDCLRGLLDPTEEAGPFRQFLEEYTGATIEVVAADPQTGALSGYRRTIGVARDGGYYVSE